jgi:uncharacterized coiled-coil DUF342 family protein
MTGKEDKSIDECLLEPENSFLRDKIQEHVSKIEEMQRRREELEKTVDEMHKKLEELSEQKENTTTKLQDKIHRNEEMLTKYVYGVAENCRDGLNQT